MGATRRSCHQAKAANRRELAVERAAKKDAVEALNGLFKTTSVAVVAHYSGLTVAQMQKLRMQMKQAGASVKVSKNRLAKIALEGTDVVAIGSLLKGPTVIATPLYLDAGFTLSFVMAGLVPAIHVFLFSLDEAETWMPGTKAGHDEKREACPTKS